MRLTSWNLLHAMPIPPSPTANGSALLGRAIMDLDSDVIGLQEVDYYLERSGAENQVERVAKLLGAKSWAFAPSVLGSPDAKWRKLSRDDAAIITSVDQPRTPSYGIGLVSKIPVVSWHRLEFKAAPVGMPMVIPENGKMKLFYMRDHPRSAIAAVLENGWLVINTHLSFVPIYSFVQLLAIKRWVKRLPVQDKAKIVVMGDLNIPVSLFVRGIAWNSLAKQKGYPSWQPKIQLDYLLSQKVASEDVVYVETARSGISDHLPLSVDID
ncbi:unannotated protein [freshwater metagenome]|uniref:Unannotated protein n=2 Tax=freshwater metagenome TaxID=449393 RepID=A0A6J7A3L3_9ZZZZ|nr:hypothetical protein [Actinomycetota bacterium]MSW26525.1 hypothetical protein [Actinomycetota bacterium]MSW33544.1 hypothetical protein [Actinomycetota bacterium]MSX30568.1 hypothetical protein [Actinomycetota bacterium]MSX51425.1 hypothetical protein [Actinomycetota bacterium]